MLAVFALRLAAVMIGCLLLLPPRIINPRFFRTHFLTALALAGVALVCVRDDAAWPLLALLGIFVWLALFLVFFCIWVFCVFKASKGEWFKLPIIGDIAMKQAQSMNL